MTKDIYKLDLHESVITNCGGIEYHIIRVPGGWLYNHIRFDFNQMTCTFVPFDNDFQRYRSK